LRYNSILELELDGDNGNVVKLENFLYKILVNKIYNTTPKNK